MKYKYKTERGLVMNTLADELAYMSERLDIVKDNDHKYAVLMRCYLEAQREFLKLCAEAETKDCPNVDTTMESDKKSVYDERGILAL